MSQIYKYLGTLGDSFIAFCKVYPLALQSSDSIVLRRYAHPYDDIEPAVEAFFKLVPKIQYERIFSGDLDPEQALKLDSALFIETGKATESFLDFLGGKIASLKPYPFPELNLTPDSPYKLKNPHQKIMGIQLHAGKILEKKNKNYKGISLNWIRLLRQSLPNSEYKLCLFGTGSGYNQIQLSAFCQKYGIQNYVGRLSFQDWLVYIKYCHLFISPDGFSGYFSCSQRVPTMLFYNDPLVINYKCPEWDDLSSWEWKGPINKWQSRIGRWFGHPHHMYSPFSIDQVHQFIKKHLH